MKKLLIVLVLPLILLIGAAAGAFFFGFIPGFGPGMLSQSDMAAKAPKEDLPPEPYVKTSDLAVYYTMDEFVVNLQNAAPQARFSAAQFIPGSAGRISSNRDQAAGAADPRRRQHLSQQLDTRGPVWL